MNGTKQWNTVCKWRWLCHNAGQLILNTLKFGEVRVRKTKQRWIATIETTRHKSSCKYFCTIQIKVTVNSPQIPDVVIAWAADCWYMRVEGEISVRYYSQIPSRFCWVSSDTKKLNRKHRELFAPLPFVPNKEEFSFIWVQFQFIRQHPWLERSQARS